MIERPRLPSRWRERLPHVPYNPLSRINLARSIADELLESEPSPLPPDKPFAGAGVYALYYASEKGGFEPYSRVNNFGWPFEEWVPIYVGKAAAPGSRTGGSGEEAELDYVPNTNLFNRLWEHAKSLEAANNLAPEEFRYRALVLDQVWIGLGEALLIHSYRPLWNQVISGFGIHVPGKGRKDQKKSEWDTIHPGRNLVSKPNSSSKAALKRRIDEHLDELEVTAPEDLSGIDSDV
jgi:hypothetical protein